MSQTTYQHLYETTRRVLERYQNEILPAYRKEIEQLRRELETSTQSQNSLTQTVGDFIRNMPDEYLVEQFYALYLMSVEHDGGEISTLWCDGKAGCVDEYGDIECNEERHKACILRWLKSEAKPDAE
ncbi:MAG: hypothetical protein IJV74_06890 [Clostridia bacterium]|nr:hypothetical protein [Clostridia bacterium]